MSCSGQWELWTVGALDSGSSGRWELWTVGALDSGRSGRWELWTVELWTVGALDGGSSGRALDSGSSGQWELAGLWHHGTPVVGLPVMSAQAASQIALWRLSYGRETETVLLLSSAEVGPMNREVSSVQLSRSVAPYSLQPHGLQPARPPCPSPTPRACPNSCP